MPQATAPQPTIDFRWHTYGKWLAMGPPETKGKEEFRVCRCSCERGTVAEIHYLALTEGRAKSCGCDRGHWRKPNGKSRLKDLTGQLFGNRLVLRRVSNSRTGLVRWECQCVCGEIKNVASGHLLSGKALQCLSCAQIKPIPQRWIGQRFVSGRIVKRAQQVFWETTCICGEKRNVSGENLGDGPARTTTCGCPGVPMIGQYFGFYYVLERSTNIGNDRGWLCQCVCGFHCAVSTSYLVNGRSKSCGCRGKTVPIGAVFGRLTVLASAGRSRWLCRCECGRECSVRGKHLWGGNRKSCDCLARNAAGAALRAVAAACSSSFGAVTGEETP